MGRAEDNRSRVIVVDDSPSGFGVWPTSAACHGFDFSIFTTALAALTQLQQEPLAQFDALVIELSLPDMDGFELFGRVRKIIGPKRLVFILTPEVRDFGGFPTGEWGEAELAGATMVNRADGPDTVCRAISEALASAVSL